MLCQEKTFNGKQLPKHVKMFRDCDSGRIELRYWRFQPMLIFLIPFMCVWSGGAIFGCYVAPFLKHGSHPVDYMPFISGIPFLIVSIAIWTWILSMLFGARKLILEHGRGSYSVKLFGIGRTKKFDINLATEIVEHGAKKVSWAFSASVPNNPFARKLRIKNGYRSEMICSFWDDDAIDFAIEMIKRYKK